MSLSILHRAIDFEIEFVGDSFADHHLKKTHSHTTRKSLALAKGWLTRHQVLDTLSEIYKLKYYIIEDDVLRETFGKERVFEIYLRLGDLYTRIRKEWRYT